MDDWEMQEPGWYTSPLGGIYEEEPGKWFFYPAESALLSDGLGPWKTLKRAKKEARLAAGIQFRFEFVSESSKGKK